MAATDVATHRTGDRLHRWLGALSTAGALCAIACDADRPPGWLAPTPVARPAAAPEVDVPGALWQLRTTIVAIEGSACFWPHPVGAVFNWQLAVERSESQIRLLYDVRNAHDNLLFVGEPAGDAFSAATATSPGWWACSGDATLSSSVTGRFTVDGNGLTAREQLTYRAASGELVITFDWLAAPM